MKNRLKTIYEIVCMNITDGNTKLSELDVEIAMPPTINKNELISVLEKKRSDVLES